MRGGEKCASERVSTCVGWGTPYFARSRADRTRMQIGSVTVVDGVAQTKGSAPPRRAGGSTHRFCTARSHTFSSFTSGHEGEWPQG